MRRPTRKRFPWLQRNCCSFQKKGREEHSDRAGDSLQLPRSPHGVNGNQYIRVTAVEYRGRYEAARNWNSAKSTIIIHLRDSRSIALLGYCDMEVLRTHHGVLGRKQHYPPRMSTPLELIAHFMRNNAKVVIRGIQIFSIATTQTDSGILGTIPGAYLSTCLRIVDTSPEIHFRFQHPPVCARISDSSCQS